MKERDENCLEAMTLLLFRFCGRKKGNAVIVDNKNQGYRYYRIPRCSNTEIGKLTHLALEEVN